MSIENDIIINYSNQDNATNNDSEIGWVDNFKKFLEVMLFQVLGEKPEIILKSEGSSISKSELDKTGLMICILSSEFSNSEQCISATKKFYNLVQNDDSKRIFKVLKSHVQADKTPEILKDFIPYELYEIDETTDGTVAFIDYFGPAAERVYWMKMVDLTYDVHESLIQIKGQGLNMGKVRFGRQTIYLAETSHDLNTHRNVIRRELQRHGYTVLPKNTLPEKLEEVEKVIRQELEDSVLSIHLIGNTYGNIPEGSERSIVEIQNRLAAEKAKNNPTEKLQRLIWIKPDQSLSSQKQITFIENIQRDTLALEAAEVLQTPLEDFKNSLREELLELSNGDENSPMSNQYDPDKRNVYILYDKIDQSDITPIIKQLVKSGLNVIEPNFVGDLLDIRKTHIDNLKLFDLSIIYQGKVNDNWVKMKLLDLIKSPGFGRDKPIIGKAIVGGVGVKLNKKAYDSFNVELIESETKEGIANKIDTFISDLTRSL